MSSAARHDHVRFRDEGFVPVLCPGLPRSALVDPAFPFRIIFQGCLNPGSTRFAVSLVVSSVLRNRSATLAPWGEATFFDNSCTDLLLP